MYFDMFNVLCTKSVLAYARMENSPKCTRVNLFFVCCFCIFNKNLLQISTKRMNNIFDTFLDPVAFSVEVMNFSNHGRAQHTFHNIRCIGMKNAEFLVDLKI
jgi:hypothetical protein